MPAPAGMTLLWREHAPGCRILQCTTHRQAWVFGLNWLPTVGARSRNLLLKQLRRESVRWWIAPDGRSGTIGFLPVASAPSSAIKEGALRSAAVHFATLHPTGAHLVILNFGATERWAVGVSEGNVLCQTDCWVDSDEQILEIERDLRLRFNHLQVCHHKVEPVESDGDALPDFLRPSSDHKRLLLKPLKGRRHRIMAILFVLIVLVLSAVYWQHSQNTKQRSRFQRVDSSSRVVEFDPEIELSHPGDLAQIAEIWSPLTIDPAGWLLERVTCERKSQQIDCRAAYQRQSADATNLHLDSVRPKGWAMEPVSLDRTDLTYHLRDSVRTVRVSHLDSQRLSTRTHSNLLTDLQDLSAYTYAIEMGEMSPFLTMPRLASSQPVPGSVRQASLQIFRRTLRMSLPMREMGRVASLPHMVLWKVAHLEVVNPRLEKTSTTRLRSFLEGEVFEYVSTTVN